MSNAESDRAKKRLKVFSGMGLSTNQRQLAKALSVLHALPQEDQRKFLEQRDGSSQQVLMSSGLNVAANWSWRSGPTHT